jgi:hypothetical protein
MSGHITARLLGASVDLGHGKPVVDLGDALNLNVSEAALIGVPAIESEPTTPRERRSFNSRDEVEQFLQSRKP